MPLITVTADDEDEKPKRTRKQREPDLADADFAVAIQKRANEALARGELRVTASHGLQAQALLDRRAEKEADRNLALNMARLLSGAISMPPVTVIEGRATPVELITDGLAPMGVVEPVDA